MVTKRANNFAFIDSQNLNLAIRGQGWRLDFVRFRRYLKEKYHIMKAFMFLGYIPENQRMYTILQDAGYLLIFKPTIKHPDGQIKGNVDAELVLHAMIEYKNYDRAVIVTGDGDFYCLVEYLLGKNKLERLLIPNQYSHSSFYRRLTSRIHFMNGLKRKLAYKSTHKKERH